ncbi:MAG: dethiobiotin synthase [Bacteroidota bacterium]
MRGYVVAGIGTEIGKTVVSAILCRALKATYWKPVQAGELDWTDRMKVQHWTGLPEEHFAAEAYALTTPMSPHGAAPIDGVIIKKDKLFLPDSERPLLVELAGGIMVPLNEHHLNIDLLKTWQLPVILVSRYYLGNINHSLLTAAVLKEAGVPVQGWILNGSTVPTTKEAILRHSQLPLLAEIPESSSVDRKFVQVQAERLGPSLRASLGLVE